MRIVPITIKQAEPSQELLRRAHTFWKASHYDKPEREWPTEIEWLAQFGEDIVRECAEITRTYEDEAAILSKFGLLTGEICQKKK